VKEAVIWTCIQDGGRHEMCTEFYFVGETAVRKFVKGLTNFREGCDDGRSLEVA
jgi:hypothetical protein